MPCATRIFVLVFAAVLLTSCAEDKQPPDRVQQKGERVPVGHLVYTVFETQWLPKLGDDATPRVPKNRFYLVRMSTVNGGSEEMLLPNVSLEDDSGNTYPELTDGTGVPLWVGVLRKVAPSGVSQGNVAFDVPPGHYRLRVRDEDNDKSALIDLPFSFDSEAPDLPVPSGDKKK